MAKTGSPKPPASRGFTPKTPGTKPGGTIPNIKMTSDAPADPGGSRGGKSGNSNIPGALVKPLGSVGKSLGPTKGNAKNSY